MSLRTLLGELCRRLALRHDRAVGLWRRLAPPNGVQWADYLRRHGQWFEESGDLEDLPKVVDLFLRNGFARKLEVRPAERGHYYVWHDLFLLDAYQRVQELTQGQGVDAIFDMDFSSTARLLDQGALRPHGQLVCYGSNDMGELAVNFRTLLWGSLGLKFFLVYELSAEDRREAIKTLTTLLEAKQLTHKIRQTFPLKDIAAAHEAVEGGQVVGNVVLTLD